MGFCDSQLQEWFWFPEKAEGMESSLKSSLLLTNKLMVADNPRVLVLYFQHGLPIGLFVSIVAFTSVSFSVFWAVSKSDISGGFGTGGFFVSLMAFITMAYLRNGHIGRAIQR